MPQLFPMNWTFLSSYFFLSIISLISMIYFIPFFKKKKKLLLKKEFYKNWMW
uniref:ATP synthase F0 subunit 8 n=1 Tax=Navis striatus TaxID=1580118 RepID=UPI0007393D4F|nr:ATP synthase F0 subunit 8 [Navis striatus]AIZ58452.1 ATP synthase F0 subunit 8 [Navis striatus]AIZ58465.1 ATP synthase F0 subunit 8 [Navis striatus]